MNWPRRFGRFRKTPPSDIDPIALLGTIDAGEAGIRVSSNVNLAALQLRHRNSRHKIIDALTRRGLDQANRRTLTR